MRIMSLAFLVLISFCLLGSPAFAASAKGEGVYMNFCSSCHASGIAGAPKTGDKAAWAARIAAGRDTLNSNAINGLQGAAGYMPPKGGRADLSDEEIVAAVDYLVEQVQ